MKITPLGDSALTIHVCDEFQSDPEGCLREVGHVLRLLQEARLPGLSEVTPAFTSVSMFYDPAQIADGNDAAENVCEWLAEKIPALVVGAGGGDHRAESARLVEIPVCYDKEFGLDLGIVAAQAGLTETDVIAAHSGATYRVGCIGFVPGFPFLIGLPRALATPRRATPRTQVPAGSVAIGGAQTGIYPQQSPGGWNVIGRTPQRLFDVELAAPALLAQGDVVRFRSITRAEFEALAVAAVCDRRSAESSQMSPGESAVIDRRYRE